MANRLVTRSNLLERWRDIEDEDDEDDNRIDSSRRRRLHQQKEQWFAEAFNFLISLPKEDHIWCGAWDIMGPLLETFYNYFKDKRCDSPLKQLWGRISKEMRHCIQCICQHHQAQEMYNMEYELSSIGPLLDILRSLDEERVTQHLREINTKLARQEYDPACDNAEFVSAMYEVLMYPILLDDQSLFTEFENFIEAVDNLHELALGGQQQFPGVYALFFFKRSVRSVGHRLAACMGKLRRATDLEPLQPLIKKFIGFLETEVLPSTSKTSRPRAELDRVSIWLGIKSLLGFLEPPAFEEGILERYPIFLDIVLNHISGDSVDFSHAVTCLRLLFEILGCKVWLRSTLSSSVMRNTLLGQCFHTRNEKIHKDIFDLFQPFLQSLEALQDGEHVKQRRHFLYFLLHQVPVSSNFSVLTRQKARQIALLIVHRGYVMNPPCPPFECAHMWGPSLVLSLKDSSLHNSLRQPALDLIQTIMVSDAACLVNSVLSCCPPSSVERFISSELKYEEDNGSLSFSVDAEQKDDSCWSGFSKLCKISSLEFREWMCIPMLWIDVLIDINPSVLPVSFSKAVFWARTRFSMVEPESSSEMAIPVRSWLSSSATDISTAFGWGVPTGSDDGGDGKESKNSIKVSAMPLPLIRTFNRLTAHFIALVGQGELWKQWTWEPRMGESLILSLFDPNDIVRHFGKCILERVSNTRGLACGLNFLCSCGSSLFAILLGLRHALRLVQLDIVLLKFQTLHHLFFILRKLLMEGDLATPVPDESSDHSTSKFSSQGGFLRQSVFDSLPVNNWHSSNVDLKLYEKFCCILLETSWPSIQRCLIEGKTFIDYNICQMTCVRILEILPVVFERIYPMFIRQSGFSGIVKNACDFSWLHDLVDWGKSSLKVVIVYWKRTFMALLKLLKESCNSTAASTIMTIENLISCDGVSMDELMEQVSHLTVSLSKKASNNIGTKNLSSKTLSPEGLKFSASDVQPLSIEDVNIEIQDPGTMDNKKDSENLIVLSDDEEEQMVSSNEFILSNKTSQSKLDVETVAPSVSDSTLLEDSVKEKVHAIDTSKDILEPFKRRDGSSGSGFTSGKEDKDNSGSKPAALAPNIPEGVHSNQNEISSKSINDSFRSQGSLKVSSNEAVSIKKISKAHDNVVPKTENAMLRRIVCDAEYDPLDAALDSVIRQPPKMVKPVISVPKRQLIQLDTPVGNRFGHLQRLEARAKRFKPPRLDKWYKPILEIDYFATVGLSAAIEDGSRTVCKLKEVPVSFQSAEQYIEIFRPLVLEEFKAQLQNSYLEMSSLEDMYFGCLSVLSVERIDDFHLVRFSHDDNDSTSSRSFSENDLVLLTKETLQRPSHDVHMVGKVENRERDHKRRLSILLIRLYLESGTKRLHQARRNLHERSKWHASWIMSITPQVREFQALSSIKDIPMFPIILKPDNDSCGPYDYKEADLTKLAQPLQRILKSSFNDSQLQAISVAIGLRNSNKTFDLSLIQGPPGTGKTRTILAIASSLLATQKKNHARNYIDGSEKQNCTPVPKISQSAAIAKAWQDAALARQLNEDVKNHSKPMDNSVRGRILICAQSNAAVDELISRISNHGLYGSDGKMYKPYLVRVGNSKTVHANSLPFFIDTLVDQRLADEKAKLNDDNDSSVKSSVDLRSNLEKLVDRIRFYEAKRANLSDGNSDLKKSSEDDTLKGDKVKEMSDAEIGAKLRRLYEQKRQIYKDLSSVQAMEKKTNEEIRGLKYKLRKSILREAEIVVATLSGCGGDLYGVCSESMSSHKFGGQSEHILFDAVVIDEAAQALEPATLIPLQLLKSSGTKCVMVGDPKQLPATVLSNVASKYFYECSMFERLQRAGHPVVMLTTQYRMHPEICQFPSLHFYEGKLLNGDKMSSKSAPFHETEGLGPYVFYDIIDGQERRGKSSGSLSLCNEHEADAAVEVLKFFKKRHPSEFIGGRIGLVTPYKSQCSLLRSRFSSAFGSSVIDEMEFNTVDGFQGREVDILILSTVRAAERSAVGPGIKSSNIGFVADVRRMNVALTRAKLSLWIMGNAKTLQTNKSWAALIKDAKDRNLVITVRMPYRSIFKSANRRKPAAENPENILTKKRTERSENETSDHITNNVAKRRRDGDAKDFSTSREDSRVNKRNARYAADLPSLVVNDDNRDSKDGESVVSGKIDTECKIKDSESCSKEIKFEDSPMDKREIKETSTRNMDKVEQGMDESHRRLKSKVSKRMKASTEDVARRHRNLDVSTPPAVSDHKERDSSGEGRALNRVDTSKDLMAIRKQQREAVDAILGSHFLPSKKPQTVKKSAPSKKPPPSSTASGGMKPPRRRKD